MNANKGLLWICAALAAPAWAGATFALEGNYRFGTNFFKNTDVISGPNSAGSDYTAFVEQRFLLRPNVVIDDRFTVKSEINVLQSNPNTYNSVPEAFGMALGSSATQFSGHLMPVIRRVWMEWASDFGILRVGRMPKSWGLGIFHNAGDGVYDDFGTTVDRLGFQALMGNITFNLGYEKAQEGIINFEGDDAENYELTLGYTNPDFGLDVGLLYGRAIRPSGGPRNSTHDLSLFVRKALGSFHLDGEFISSSEDVRGSGLGALLQADYANGPLKIGADYALAYAPTGSSFSLHPNYRPFLILFQQSLGPTNVPGTVRGGASGYATAVGGAVATTNGPSTMTGKMHASYGFSDGRYTLGGDVGAAGNNGSGGGLMGVEVDLHLTQKWYDNFSSFYGAGLLIPGPAFGAGRAAVWGAQLKGALTF